jgi:hypothetical protein
MSEQGFGDWVPAGSHDSFQNWWVPVTVYKKLDSARTGPITPHPRDARFPHGGAAGAIEDGDVVPALQVEPESGAVAEMAGKVERRVRGHRSAAMENVGDAPWRHAGVDCKAVGAQVPRLSFVAEKAAGVNDGCHGPSLVIIGNLHIMGVAIPERKMDAPPRIDADDSCTEQIATRSIVPSSRRKPGPMRRVARWWQRKEVNLVPAFERVRKSVHSRRLPATAARAGPQLSLG